MTFKGLTQGVLSTLIIAALVVPFGSSFASVDGTLGGTTADFDYVFTATDEGDVNDITSDVNDDVFHGTTPAFYEDRSDQALYMGMENALFDKLVFTLDDAIVLEDVDADDDEADEYLVFQYWNGDAWAYLDVEYGRTGGLTSINGRQVEWTIPSDWETLLLEGEDYGYIVRVVPLVDVEHGGDIVQMAARAYTVVIELTNNNGDEITGLDAGDFRAVDCDDSFVYGVYEIEDGVYHLAIQTEGRYDSDCNVSIEADKYYNRTVNVQPGTDAPYLSRVLTYAPSWADEVREECPTPFIDIDGHWGASAIREIYCTGAFTDTDYFKPNTRIQKAEFVKLLLESAQVEIDYDGEEVYRDVEEGDWYYEYVMTAYDLGIVDDATRFYPEKQLERAEAVKIAMELANLVEDINTSDRNARYSDVDSSDWYAGTLKAATNYQIVVGYEDGTFRPERTLSRAEAVTIVNNYWYAFVRSAENAR